MATLFLRRHALFGKRTACAACLTFFLFATTGGTFAEKFGRLPYVITAQDRARADALYQEAFAAFQAGDYPKALNSMDQAERLKPDQPDGWNLRGMVHLKQRTYEQARAAFARAAALDPTLWAAQFNLAETSFQQKDYPRARKGFERLLAQTDRFKQGSRWELIEYKAFLCCLLAGDLAGANERLAKLPANGAATPARLYAEAALAYRNKKGVGAPQAVAAAQGKFSPQVNGLFADSLVQAGWATPAPIPALLAASPDLSPGMTLATSPAPGMSAPISPYYVVDPKVEAAAAEPLPLPDAGVHPIVGKLNPALPTEPTRVTNGVEKVPPARAVAVQNTPAPQPTPDVELEHKDLLLTE